MSITPKQRKEIETKIYETFSTLDKTNTNTEHYKKILSKMTDAEMFRFISNDFPYRFHHTPFKIEPSMDDCCKTLKKLGVPLMEKIQLPYLHEDKTGTAVASQECMVGYGHLKKLQQFISKKNSMSIDIAHRDMKTGLLSGVDKNGKTSDREMEILAILGLDKTMVELSKPRADATGSKNAMYNQINQTGMVALEDLPDDIDDSLSKNLFNTYLIGTHVLSNIVAIDTYMLPHTLKSKNRTITKI